MAWKVSMERAADLSVAIQIYSSGMETLLSGYAWSIQTREVSSTHLLQPSLWQHLSFSRYWRNAAHAKRANKGRKEKLPSAVECRLACWLLCTHTHTHSFMDTQRDPEGGEKGKFFSLTLSLTNGASEFSERAAKIWRRIQLQLVFHICVGCSGFQIKSAS